MPENFINKMAHFVAFCHSRADAYYYSEDRNQDMVDYYLVRSDAARDICTMFECTSEVWAEAKKIYDFTNSGREGYTLRDGKIVKIEEVNHG